MKSVAWAVGFFTIIVFSTLLTYQSAHARIDGYEVAFTAKLKSKKSLSQQSFLVCLNIAYQVHQETEQKTESHYQDCKETLANHANELNLNFIGNLTDLERKIQIANSIHESIEIKTAYPTVFMNQKKLIPSSIDTSKLDTEKNIQGLVRYEFKL